MYCVNDFISEEDLALLRQSAALESVEHDAVNLTVDDRVLRVDTSEATQLSVFDISGKTVFNGEILQSTTIPLDHIASPFIFVRYTTANDTAIKKLLLR